MHEVGQQFSQQEQATSTTRNPALVKKSTNEDASS